VRGELLYSNRLMFLEHFQVHSKAEKKGGRKEGKEGGREIDRWNLLVIGFPCS
jgi:hypothetical protein